MNLERNTRALMTKWIDGKGHSITRLAADAGIGYHWLVSFRRYPDAGANVRHVQKLYDFLEKQE